MTVTVITFKIYGVLNIRIGVLGFFRLPPARPFKHAESRYIFECRYRKLGHSLQNHQLLILTQGIPKWRLCPMMDYDNPQLGYNGREKPGFWSLLRYTMGKWTRNHQELGT